MALSKLAQDYLLRHSRDPDPILTDHAALLTHFHTHQIPPFEKVIDAYLNYSNIRLTITKRPTSDFYTDLLLPSGKPGETCIKIGDRHYFFFGEAHATAQFWFVLSDSGELGTYDNNDHTTHMLFSSLEKFIETYAREDQMHRTGRYEHRTSLSVKNPDKLETFLVGAGYKRDQPACDEYNTWLTNGATTIYIGRYYDEDAYFLHIYGETREQCELLAKDLNLSL